MNKYNSGKQQKRCDTVIPQSNPDPCHCGQPQSQFHCSVTSTGNKGDSIKNGSRKSHLCGENHNQSYIITKFKKSPRVTGKEILEGWVGDDRFVLLKCLYLREVENLGIARHGSLKPRFSTSLRYKHFNNTNLSSPTHPSNISFPVTVRFLTLTLTFPTLNQG